MPDSFEDWKKNAGATNSGGFGQGLGVNAVPTSGTPDNPNVFLGRRERTAPGAAGAAGVGRTGYGNSGYDIRGNGPKYDEVQDANTAAASIYSWPPAEQQALAKRLYNAGLLDDPTDLKKLSAIWGDAVYQAGMQYTMSDGRTRVTPLQYLNARIDLAVTGGVGANTAPKTTTSTNTNVYLPDKSDAQAAVSTLFQESMGRDPDEQEMERYVSMMMASYKKNPSTTTTTSTTDRTGNTTSKTRTTGQYNPAQDLEDRVESDPEWGAYQAATTYFNALQQALGAPANLT